MSSFKVVVPEATTNLFTDPQFGAADPATAYDISATGGSSPDVTRVTTDQWVGTGCASFDFDGASAMIMKLDVAVTATSYTVSMRVKRTGGGTVSNSHTQCRFDTSNDNWDSITAERDGWYLCVRTATATSGTREFGIRALEDGLLTDAWQMEELAYRTTHCNGEMVGNRKKDGYLWTGDKHASTSKRHAQERSGGRVRDIEDDLSVASVTSFDGGGEPIPDHTLTDLALLDGELYEDTAKGVRFLDLGLVFNGTSVSDLHSNRNTFLKEIRVNKTTPKQPFKFRYTGAATTKEIDALYAGGANFVNPNKFVQKEGFRMLCPSPYFNALGEISASLTVQQTVSNSDMAIERDADGLWAAIAAFSTLVDVVKYGPDGKLYLGGSFTNAGDANGDYIVSWDGTSLASLGTGMNGTVRDIVFGPDGSLYACGDFTTAGGGAAVRVAKWDGSSWSALSTGLGAQVNVLAFGPDGTLYAGGTFVNAGGDANGDRIAKWNGTAWASLGGASTGFTSGTVNGIAIGLDGTIFAGGTFVNAGGDANADCMAKYSGGAWSSLASTSFDTAVGSVRVGPNGLIYIGGSFTKASSSPGDYICYWDGSGFSDMAGGMDAAVNDLNVTAEGVVYVAGVFTTAGSKTIPGGFAKWAAGGWLPLDMVPPSGWGIINSIDATVDGRIAIGYAVAGDSTTGATTTVTNDGSAEASVQFIATGPGQLFQLINHTTGAEIYFNLTLNSGETVVLNLEGNKASFTSTYSDGRAFKGDIRSSIINGSNLAGFGLNPGANIISLFIDDATASAFIKYKELHETIDS